MSSGLLYFRSAPACGWLSMIVSTKAMLGKAIRNRRLVYGVGLDPSTETTTLDYVPLPGHRNNAAGLCREKWGPVALDEAS